MPKVKTKTTKKGWQQNIYKCSCGKEITFETDFKPKRLSKCFVCASNDRDIMPLEVGMI